MFFPQLAQHLLEKKCHIQGKLGSNTSVLRTNKIVKLDDKVVMKGSGDLGKW